jgi:IS30 family transposase
MGSRYSDELMGTLWESWKRGVSLGVVSGEVGRPLNSLYRVISDHGGIAPRPRRRAARCLKATEREEISRGMASGLSIRAIARSLGRAASTVSREIGRNGGRREYRAARADRRAWRRAKRPKPCRLVLNEALRLRVAAKLQQNCSPEQISGWLKLQFPNDPAMQVSTETIYRSLFVQSRGALKRELLDHLRSKRRTRRASNGGAIHVARRKIVGAVSIRERPAEVEDRAIPGHWEGDLLAGARFSNIATLVERHTRFTMLVKVPSKHSEKVVTALAKQVCKLPVELRRSLTWDQGVEMSQHAKFTVATDVQVYFCDPHSPWQRGSNENTNGLLRQYFPHGTDLSRFTQAQLNKVALSLNQRPRKILGFHTPAEKLEEVLR